MNIEQLTAFFAWCTVINGGLLIFATLGLWLMRGVVLSLHAKMFAVSENDLPGIYMRYLAYFKIAIIVFNLTPYLALRIVA